MSTVARRPEQQELFGHPVGLYILFFTEMWERFSYYGMRAILTLYLVGLTTDKNPGLGWTNMEALQLYGWYTMLVYVMSIPGGILADKVLGQKKAVLYGGLILIAGHSILAVQTMWAFYTGLILIILGVGMLKPNISTMVGGLYKQGDIRRDKGFTIFYIGINIGAFLAALIVGYVGEVIGWHYGFGLAGIGMALGMGQYIYGQKYLAHVGNFLGAESASNEEKEVMKKPLTSIEKDRIKVLLLSFLIVIVFWGAFEQAGGLMSIYTKVKTNRNASLLTMSLIFYIPIVLLLLKGIIDSIKKKKNNQYWFIGAAFIGVVYFFLNKYMFISNPFNIPASWFQSLNSFFIIVLGTSVAGFWAKRKLKGKESSSLFKMAIGTIIMGTGFLFMSAATAQFNAQGKSAMYWLVLAYLFHTVGELSSSPVALSFITKLAPVKYASLMMGLYFAMTGLGNKLAGVLGESASAFGDYAVFTGIAVFCMIFGLLILAILKPLNRLTHGAEDDEHVLAADEA